MKADSGIWFENILLSELSFKLNKDFKPPKEGVEIDLDFSLKNSYGKDKKSLMTRLTAVLFKSTDNAPFRMKVVIEGLFKGEFNDLKDFSRLNAPAHLFPYLREVISATTLKANMPPLVLPPLNVAELLSAIKKKV